jgi:NitT/TauT family transport system permease protein
MSGLDSTTLAPPSAIAAAGARAVLDGSLLAATAQTLGAAFVGLAIGVALGLAAGIAFGLLRPLDRLMEVTVEVIRPVPPVAIIPILIIMSGLGFRTEVTTVAFACIWPALILSRSAVTGVEPRLIEVSRALRLSPLARIGKIILPSILPNIVVAVRLSIGFALIVAITVEMTANPVGLGYAMIEAQQALNPALMLAVLLWIGAIGWALNALLLMLAARAMGGAGRQAPSP